MADAGDRLYAHCAASQDLAQVGNVNAYGPGLAAEVDPVYPYRT
jgi:hypothetical protein